MSERKFDLPGGSGEDTAEALPTSTTIVEKAVPASQAGAGQEPSMASGAPDAAGPAIADPASEAPPSAPPSVDSAPLTPAPVADVDGQGGPLLSPADEAAEPPRQDTALAATIEPIEDPVAPPVPPAVPSAGKDMSQASTVEPAPASPTIPVPAAGVPALEADAPLPPSWTTSTEPTMEAVPAVEATQPSSSPAVAWLPPPDPVAAIPLQTSDLRPETRIANAEPIPSAPEPVVAAPVAQPPTIDAIELEGDASYISGSGPAGALIRLYADGELLGESSVAEGRWLVETGPILSQPRRELRARAIEPDTGKLLGEAVITVEIQGPDAPSSPESAPAPEGNTGPGTSEPAATAAPPTPPAEPPAAAGPVDATETVTAPQPPPDDPDAPDAVADQPAADSPDASSIPGETGPEVKAASTDGPLPPLDAIVPREESASVQILPPPSTASDAALPVPADTGSVIALPGPSAPALVAEFELPSRPATGSVTMLTLIPFGDPLEGRFTGGKAIIRRGDTLWSIAHRYYGSGIHYRTIFKANRDLIARPSKIFPGQVFDLPLVTEE